MKDTRGRNAPTLSVRALCIQFAALLLLADAPAQGSPAPGFRITGQLNSTSTELIDVVGGVVHTWPSRFLPGTAVYVLEDGTLLRSIRVAGSPAIDGAGGGVQRLAFDGTVLWDYRYDGPGYFSHHDIHPMPNGNILMIAWDEKTTPEAIQAGRDPALLSGSVFRPDHIVEVQPSGPTGGNIVWEWHVWDHLIQDFDPTVDNFGVVGDHPELVDINYPPAIPRDGDWNHANGIDYDPIHDWIVLSARELHEIWIIDHSTTTSEAGGHTGGLRGRGGDLLYRWGNPAAYRRGTVANQQLDGQHDPRFIPPGSPGEGNLTVFNNNVALDRSAVFEIELPLDAGNNFILPPGGTYGPLAPIWSYSDPAFFSRITSSAQRLRNGNTLICSGTQAWLFEVTPTGQIEWSYITGIGVTLFHTHYVERNLWTSGSSLSASSGGSIGFELVAGGNHSNSVYLVLGSLSGTTPGNTTNGITLPLNSDPLFLFMALNANFSPLLNRTIGLIQPGGRAIGSLDIPSGFIPSSMSGQQMHFAYILADPSTLMLTSASNAVPVLITP